MNELNNIIHKVIYINLEEATERKKSCIKILKSIFDKDKIIRFNAIKDKYLGATKSHIGCLELAIQNNWNNILIVEDDLSIYNENNNIKSLSTLYKLLNKKFDVIVLGGTNILYNPWNNNLYRCNSGTSYIINKNYYLKLKNHYQEGLYKLENSILLKEIFYYQYIFDDYWIKLQKKDNWKIIYPPIFYQKDNYSYVNDKIMIHENAFHRVNFNYYYSKNLIINNNNLKLLNEIFKIYNMKSWKKIRYMTKFILIFLLIKYKLLWILYILLPIDIFFKFKKYSNNTYI